METICLFFWRNSMATMIICIINYFFHMVSLLMFNFESGFFFFFFAFFLFFFFSFHFFLKRRLRNIQMGLNKRTIMKFTEWNRIGSQGSFFSSEVKQLPANFLHIHVTVPFWKWKNKQKQKNKVRSCSRHTTFPRCFVLTFLIQQGQGDAK